MAFSRTKLVIVVLVTVLNGVLCESDSRTQSYSFEDLEDVNKDDIGLKPKDIEPEKNVRDFERQNSDNETSSSDDETPTTIEDYTMTTYLPAIEEEAKIDVEEKNIKTKVIEEDKQEVPNTDTIVDATESIVSTLSSLDNKVYKHTDGANEDIYLNRSNNDRMDIVPSTIIPTTTKLAEDPVVVESRVGDFEEEDIQGQRSPKTDNTEPDPANKGVFDPKPHPPPVVSKSTTLRNWLEDSWLRPPAGILVPLRPMALNRALAVWNDLTVGGLNLSDIVIVGYDSNGVNWRSRHNLQHSSSGGGERAVSAALSRLLLKYRGVNAEAGDGTMRALASAAKLVPYDSALFVVTDKGAGDPQRLPLALRALVEKRLKVYTIWTDPEHPSTDSEAALHELRNVSSHTEGDVLPYSLQVMDIFQDMEGSSNLASDADVQDWRPTETRRGRLNTEVDMEVEKFETLLVRRGGGEAISVGVPVENGVTALKIYIEGAVEHAVLYPPNDGPQIDLYNKSSVTSFSPSSRTEGLSPRDVLLVFPGASSENDMLSVIPASPPMLEGMTGVWHLSIRCDTCDYRLYVGARAPLHFNIENEKPDMLKFRITGPVSSVRESSLVDEYGNVLAKLSYSYPPVTRSENSLESLVTELIADVTIPSVKGSRVYAKVVGRDIKGDPFVRLAGPLPQQAEVRQSRSAAIVFPDSRNDLELAEEANSKIYNGKLQYNDSNILPFNRAVSQVVNQRGSLLTTVQIGLSTRLYGAPGDNLQLHFEVTNYREQAVSFRFQAIGEQRFLTGISPAQRTIASGQTENVIVSLTITSSAQPGARDFITFTAYGVEQVSISAYVYVINPGQTPNDVWAPELRHNFQGTCMGRLGDDCAQHVWSATVIARDTVGGLLRLSSSPIGLVYDSNFISGSREEVIATYRATCCAPRLVVTAVDAFGNANSYVIDISNYITGAGIAAIVLGVFLAIALILITVFLIYWCVKRRRESRELPSYATSSRNIS